MYLAAFREVGKLSHQISLTTALQTQWRLDSKCDFTNFCALPSQCLQEGDADSWTEFDSNPICIEETMRELKIILEIPFPSVRGGTCRAQQQLLNSQMHNRNHAARRR